MKTIRGSLKVLMFLVIVFIFLVVSFIGQLFLRKTKTRRHFFTGLSHGVSRIGTWFLNVEVKAKNMPGRDQNYLFVSNHLGILDIICLASIHPSLFVTSVEMRQTPGLGLLCEMAGCLFVERRNRSNIHKEIDQIREALTQGMCITLYPEGTSTNGERVLPFKKSLLVVAAGTGVPIMPLVVNYREVNGEKVTSKNRDNVCWYGDQTFPPILWRLLTNTSVKAELEFLEPIQVHSDEDRREVASRVQAMIEEKFTPIPVA